MNAALVSLAGSVVTLVGVLAGQFFTRHQVQAHLTAQDSRSAEIHVLVNARLTDALKVGELLAAQLTNAGMEPVIAVPAAPTLQASAKLAADLGTQASDIPAPEVK